MFSNEMFCWVRCIGWEFIIICVCDRISLYACCNYKGSEICEMYCCRARTKRNRIFNEHACLYEFNKSGVNMTTEFVYVYGERCAQLLIITDFWQWYFYSVWTIRNVIFLMMSLNVLSSLGNTYHFHCKWYSAQWYSECFPTGLSRAEETKQV